jgi:hypothetical protein
VIDRRAIAAVAASADEASSRALSTELATRAEHRVTDGPVPTSIVAGLVSGGYHHPTVTIHDYAYTRWNGYLGVFEFVYRCRKTAVPRVWGNFDPEPNPPNVKRGAS